MKDIRNIITKLVHIEKEISKDMGQLNLFALLLREGDEKWDLLVSAAWTDRDKYDSLKYIASKLQSELNQEELFEISGIVIIDDRSIIDNINKGIYKYPYKVDYPHVDEITNYDISGITIRHGYIMALHTSRPSLALA
jgi:hypothetical protein